MAGATPNDDARIGAVRQALAAGDIARAASLAETALRDGLNHPMLVAVLITHFEQQERFEDALDLQLQLKAVMPANLPLQRAIGLSFLRLDRLDEAVAEFDSALEIDPRCADVLSHRAMALTGLGRIGEARRDFESALAIEPSNIVTLSGLAGLALRRGDPSHARSLAMTALKQRPGLPAAMLTAIGADLAEGRSAQAEVTARKLADDGSLSVKDRVIAFGLRGEALDAQGRFEEAFRAWGQANVMLREAYRSSFEGQVGTLELVKSFTAVLRNRKVEESPSPSPSAARTHVFLLGFPRSGTTLLEQVLEEHPAIVTMPERDCLVEGSREWLADRGRLEALLRTDGADLKIFREAYWRRVAAQGIDPTARVFVDKNPFNTFRLPLIARLFPNALILFAARDPRDVVLSCFRHRFQMTAAAWQLLTLDGAAELYDATMELAEASAASFALKLHRTALETMVGDFHGETARICAFLGVEWTPAFRDFGQHVAGREVATPSGPQLVGGLNTRGIGKWRNYDSQLAPIFPILQPWIDRFAERVDKRGAPS